MWVFQDWLEPLTLQQQSVLVIACRGPDGIGKTHPIKPLVAAYRASVLKAAYLGRAMLVDESDATTFMSLGYFSSTTYWEELLDIYFEHVDSLPHHYHMHLMHGAEIIGYHHPEPLFRARWLQFYLRSCDDLHLMHETEFQMDQRLNDWDRKFWTE